jgi:hypothetical protein
MVRDKDLSKRLSSLGFQLFETEEAEDANRTLADVVRSHDLRLWEGFPVVLANSVAKGLFDHDKTTDYLKTAIDRSYLESLIAMSLALYEAYGARFSWTKILRASLSDEKKDEINSFLKMFKRKSPFRLGSYRMSADRLMTVFRNYSAHSGPKLNDLLSEREELGLEYALSQVFSPKQKELFLKKLKGEKLSKTESEYFSRVVKKKVLSLANTGLHHLARRLVE